MAATYDEIGADYDGGRRPDARIQARVRRAVGGAKRVVDIGTGTGNYSPVDRFCVGVDPSLLMLASRSGAGHRRAVQATAEHLPFETGSFDCSLGVLTAHHWTDLDAGLDEMKRTSQKQVLFIREPFRTEGDFWLLDYFPSIMAVEAVRNYPTVDDVRRTLIVTEVEDVPVPADCTDGFLDRCGHKTSTSSDTGCLPPPSAAGPPFTGSLVSDKRPLSRSLSLLLLSPQE